MSNVTLTSIRAAILIVGSQTGQSRRLAALQGAQLRQGGQQQPGGALAYALNGR